MVTNLMNKKKFQVVTGTGTVHEDRAETNVS